MQRGQRLRDLARALPRIEVLLDSPRQRLDVWGDRLPAALIRGVQMRRVALSEAGGALRPGVLRRMIDGDTRRLAAASERMGGALQRRTRDDRRRLDTIAARFTARVPSDGIAAKRAELDRASQRLPAAGQRQIDGWSARIAALDRLRETLGYKATLERGYAVIRSGGDLITTRKAAKKAGALEIEFADGRLALEDAAPKAKPTPNVSAATIKARTIALLTNPTSISRYENGAISTSSMPRVKRIKYKAEDALENDALIIESISTPGKTNDMYGTPAKSSILVPITEPKIKMYSVADTTGAIRVCITNRKVRSTSRRSIVYSPIVFIVNLIWLDRKVG
jgi:hypothetical protein